MGSLNIAVFVLCIHYVLAGYSHHSHTIPIEGYETKLHDLGQHVEYKETPVKVIKITKTVAVKIPVPYPVKVLEKVPYPVHVSKPYPVPVPQIIKVPHVVKVAQKDNQENAAGNWNTNAGDQGSSSGSFYGQQQGLHLGDDGHGIGRAYEVQENAQSYAPISDAHSFTGVDSNQGHDDSSSEYSYQPQADYGYQFGGDDSGKASFVAETQAYDDALNQYYKKQGSEAKGFGGQPSFNEEHSQY